MFDAITTETTRNEMEPTELSVAKCRWTLCIYSSLSEGEKGCKK
jgi:hypothetical protein